MKRAFSLLLCSAAVVAFSLILAAYGEPVNSEIWRVLLAWEGFRDPILRQHAEDVARFVVLVGGGFLLGWIFQPRGSR